MNKYTSTQEEIYKMLTENTGTHFLDSGGECNRHWQKNASKTIDDFNNELEVSYVYEYEYIERTVSVFHYLSQLELDNVCIGFNHQQNKCTEWDAPINGVCSEAWNTLINNFDVRNRRTWNTYNGDSDLSQVLQGANLTIDGEHYILIQIHNGADVRGGYTNAKLFKLEEEGLIHEYLFEYEEESQILENFEEGYITVHDSQGKEIQFNSINQ